MGNFDSPNREVCTVYENRTNTPLQALDLMNDTIFLETSRKLAERMITEGGTDPAQRIGHAYELLLARRSETRRAENPLDGLVPASKALIKTIPRLPMSF